MILITILLSFVFNASFVAHEFHFSKCDIEYSKGEKALQISLRIFIDDLEEALEVEDNITDLKLCTSKEASNADEVLSNYISKKFLISVDGELKKAQFIGKEVSEDLMAVWCYMEITNVAPEESINIQNSMLMDTFDDQKNMVVLKYSKEIKEHFLFQLGEDSGILNLN